MTRRMRVLLVALAILQCGVFALPVRARAGTTGVIQGRVVDERTQAPIAGAHVAVAAPSQQAVSVTDASGGFRFLSLSSDT